MPKSVYIEQFDGHVLIRTASELPVSEIARALDLVRELNDEIHDPETAGFSRPMGLAGQLTLMFLVGSTEDEPPMEDWNIRSMATVIQSAWPDEVTSHEGMKSSFKRDRTVEELEELEDLLDDR